MKSMKTMIRTLMAILFVVSFYACQPALAQSRDELKERFKQRDPEITRLKSDGKIGETWEGFVAVVRDDKPLNANEKKLMDEENVDRRKLYESIANKSDIRETPADVGINNALRNFASAKSDEYLKVRVGPWVTRGDVAKLKDEGKVGETWLGYVEAVTEKAANEPRVAAVINAENAARKYTYQKQARNRQSTVEQEAERAGQQKIENARSGEFVKNRDGKWVKKK